MSTGGVLKWSNPLRGITLQLSRPDSVNGFVENFGASDLAAIAGDVLASLGMFWTTF